MKLDNIITISADLICETGLHIGASSGEMHIGGVDNTVIKDLVTGEPYIPGSSLKGKMRSMLEWRSGLVRENPLSLSDYKQSQSQEVLRILKLFGLGASDKPTQEEAAMVGPTRASFWDARLDDDWAEEQMMRHHSWTDVKSENTINRITGEAKNPRQTERVPAGAKFRFRVTLKVIDGEKDLCDLFFAGMKLLEIDGIGGSTSRGYGKIRFANVQVDGKDMQAQFDAVRAFENR